MYIYGNGNLTKDVEIKTAQTGTKICNFTLAVGRDYTDVNGKRETDFFSCVAFGKTAELIGKYTMKGDKLGIHGTLQNDTYEKNGEKRTITKLIVDKVDFLTKHETKIKRQGIQGELDMPEEKKVENLPWE